MNTVPEATLHCPLCGQPNRCAPARAGHFAVACWCAAVPIAPEALRRLAPDQRRACLCAACAKAAAPSSLRA